MLRPPSNSAEQAGRPSQARRIAMTEDPGRHGSARRPGSVADEKIVIELTKAQVDRVVRKASANGTMSVLLSALRDPDWSLRPGSAPEQMSDPRLSQSLLSGLVLLSCFPLDGSHLGIVELSRMLNATTSTTHRYVTTLMAVGLLERDPATRKYRLAPVA
jgi:hypothetical protein